MKKQAGMSQFKALVWYLTGGTKENNEKPQSGQSMSRLGFDLEAVRIGSRTITFDGLILTGYKSNTISPVMLV
jgi:hypothetical protein